MRALRNGNEKGDKINEAQTLTVARKERKGKENCELEKEGWKARQETGAEWKKNAGRKRKGDRPSARRRDKGGRRCR